MVSRIPGLLRWRFADGEHLSASEQRTKVFADLESHTIMENTADFVCIDGAIQSKCIMRGTSRASEHADHHPQLDKAVSIVRN